MRREIPLLITTIAGLVFAVSYFIPHVPFGNAETIFGDWITIVQAFAVWLGVLNLLKVSLDKISDKKESSYYSIIVIVSLMATMAVGFWDGFGGIMADPQYSFRDKGTLFDWIFKFVYTPLSATMFAMLAFYVASASYRAFRARNTQATLLLIAGFLVMGGRVPLFDYLTSVIGITDYPFFSKTAAWIMDYFNLAGQRAIMIGIALGIMSSSLRIILGIERSHIGGSK